MTTGQFDEDRYAKTEALLRLIHRGVEIPPAVRMLDGEVTILTKADHPDVDPMEARIVRGRWLGELVRSMVPG